MQAFGLDLFTDLEPPGAWKAQREPAGPIPQPARKPALRLLGVEPKAIAAGWSGRAGIGWEATIDGAAFIVERGRAGDHRFVHGEPPAEDGSPLAGTLAVHHLSPDARVLRCAPADPADPAWWRVVLDSVLFSVALLHGYEALHAGALATADGDIVAITAGTGGGKSTLVSELLLRGLTLMADDVLALEPARADGASPLAHPSPPLMTVPSERVERLREGLATERSGTRPWGAPARTIAVVEDEHWVAMPVCSRPLPLRALVVLDRRAGMARTSIERDEQALATLLQGLLRFPRTRERERARFELAAQIAEQVPIWRLRADASTPPAELAERLLVRI